MVTTLQDLQYKQRLQGCRPQHLPNHSLAINNNKTIENSPLMDFSSPRSLHWELWGKDRVHRDLTHTISVQGWSLQLGLVRPRPTGHQPHFIRAATMYLWQRRLGGKWKGWETPCYQIPLSTPLWSFQGNMSQEDMETNRVVPFGYNIFKNSAPH